jgi:catecholate siderophore receptor
MLFGKGSTGGVVNQVSKQPFLLNQHEASATLGSGGMKRVQGDFNWQTGQDAALRLNLLGHDADNWGARQRKIGVAPTFRWGIGTRDEFSVGFYHLDIDGRPNYAHPWIIGADGTIHPTLPAKNFYGLKNDHLDTSATYATLGHVRRLDGGGELKTRLRAGRYERDLLGSPIGFAQPRPPTRAVRHHRQHRADAPLQGPHRRKRCAACCKATTATPSTGWQASTPLLAAWTVTTTSAKRNNNYANTTPRPTPPWARPTTAPGWWMAAPPVAVQHASQSRSIGPVRAGHGLAHRHPQAGGRPAL